MGSATNTRTRERKKDTNAFCQENPLATQPSTQDGEDAWYKRMIPKLPSISILPTFLIVLGVTVTARRARLIYLSDTSANHNSKYKN